MIVDIFNQQNNKVDTIDLPDRVFNVKWNPDLVHQALRTQLCNRRTKSADTKDRAEVRGGGKKPWKQKGTGRARHGSIRSPIWKGGGVTHGPLKERDYGLKINKKMRQLAIFSTLSKRLKDEEIKVIESLDMQESKTKLASKLLNEFFRGKSKLNTLLIPKESNKNIYSAVRNIEGVHSLSPKSLNIYDLLKYKTILIDKDAVAVINKHYHETN